MASSGAKRFTRDVALTLAARLFIAGGSFLGGVIVARWLGAESVGIIASLNVVALLAVTLGAMGMPAATTYMVASDNTRASKALMNAVVFAFAVGGLLAAGISVLYLIAPTLFGSVPGPLVFVTAAIVPFQLLSLLCLAILLGLGRIGPYNLLDMITPAALFLSPLVLLVLLRTGLYQLVAANASAVAMVAVVVAVIVSRTGQGERRIDTTLARETLRYGGRFYIAMLSSVVIMRSDVLFVNYFRGPAEAGVYAIATQVGTLLTMVPTVISTVLFPRAAGAGDARADITSMVTRHSSAVLLMVCVAAVPLAFFLPLFFGASFAASTVLVLVLLPGIYFLGVELVLVQYFNGLGLPWPLPLFWLVTMAFSIILNIIFTPRYGALAAAAISTATYALIFALVAGRFCSVTGSSIGDLLLPRLSEVKAAIGRGSAVVVVGERS